MKRYMYNTMPAKEFNANQEKEYREYCDKCKANNVDPLPFGRYFIKFPNYGYVAPGAFPIWNKRKSAFLI